MLLLEPKLAPGVLGACRSELENYEQLLALRSASAQAQAERSLFRSVPVQQLAAVFCGKAVGRSPRAWKAGCGTSTAAWGGSQLLEDGFMRQRLAEKAGRNATMAADRMWSVLVEKKVLRKKHHLQEGGVVV